MAGRSSGRGLSFKVLGGSSFAAGDESIPSRQSISENEVAASREEPTDDRKRRRRKEAKRKRKRMKNKAAGFSAIATSAVSSESVPGFGDFGSGGNDFSKDTNANDGGKGSVVAVVEEVSAHQCVSRVGELRQRSVKASVSVRIEESTSESRIGTDNRVEENMEKPVFREQEKRRSQPNGSSATRLETEESLDWKRLMANNTYHVLTGNKSPWKFIFEELCGGHSLRSTAAAGDEREREKVYDTIFQLPWRCEGLINVGFFVCFNSFLSLLTIMPIRFLTILWRTYKKRQFERPSAAELSDFGCLLVLAFASILLGWTDISLIYHMIRGQGAIKLYVVYNVLEIFDKLCLSLCGDIFQVLFGTAEGLATSSSDNTKYWIWRFVSDQVLVTAASILHSFTLLVQAITLAACIVAHNNALLALLVSNNFAEIKSNVFKRFSKDNIHGVVYSDAIERFHLFAFLLFVLAQNILEADGPWLGTFMLNAASVLFCEVLIDTIKHAFLAKFNGIKPSAYSDFLEELCKQTLKIQTEDSKKTLTFIPMAPACVVIRVLTPVFAAHLPCAPGPWRLFCVLVMVAATYVTLVSLKVLIGRALQWHAAWYVNRCRKRKSHSD